MINFGVFFGFFCIFFGPLGPGCVFKTAGFLGVTTAREFWGHNRGTPKWMVKRENPY